MKKILKREKETPPPLQLNTSSIQKVIWSLDLSILSLYMCVCYLDDFFQVLIERAKRDSSFSRRESSTLNGKAKCFVHELKID